MSELEVFKKEVQKLLKEESYDLKLDQIEYPKEKSHGDLAVPCFIFSKQKRKSPMEIALRLKQNLLSGIENNDYLLKAENIGPYLNFFIDKHKLAKQVLSKIQDEKEDYAKKSVKSVKVMIEFCSPNTNKPLHLGHVRNMLLGESVSSLLKHQGRDVVKSCLVNDRGIHICKSMLAYQLWGDNTDPKTSKKKGDHLVGDFYVLYAKHEDEEMKKLVSDMLQKWEQADPETIKLWKKMNSWVYEGFEETYKQMGVSFDKYYYESALYDKGKDIILKGLEKGVFNKDESAINAPLEKKYNIPDKVLVRSDGTTIYITQDIYLAIRKIKDYDLDSSIYVVGSEQNLHFQQLFKILELLGYEQAKKMYHLSYGMVNLPEGKMKSREGTVVDADDLLKELKTLARAEIKTRDPKIKKKDLDKRSEAIALAGLKFYMLKLDPVKEMTYNPKESLSFEGETGPYVQYTAVRIASILEKSEKNIPRNVDFDRIEDSELDLVHKLSLYSDVVSKAAYDMKPSHLANYLIELSQSFNSYYHSTKIIDTGMELERLYLIDSIRCVLVAGLGILGIEVPGKM